MSDDNLELVRKWIQTWLYHPGVEPSNATAREEELAYLLSKVRLEARNAALEKAAQLGEAEYESIFADKIRALK